MKEVVMKSFLMESSISYEGEESYLALSSDTVRLARGFEGLDFLLEQPRPGMSLFMCRGYPESDITSPFVIHDAVITFSVILSGLSEYCTSGGREGEAGACLLDVNQARDLVFTSAECDGVFRMGGGRPQCYVGLNIPLEQLHLMLDEATMESILVRGQAEKGIYLLQEMPSNEESRRIASQLLDCPLTGCCRRLFLEGKCLELLSSLLSRSNASKKTNRPAALSKNDVERLHEARRILLANMEEPPGLQALARLCGLNEFKLKRGFREIFGCTAYEALRSHRMQAAKTLLLDSDITVGTTASMVGYTNMSHFIAAFRKEFGITPGAMLVKNRRKVA